VPFEVSCGPARFSTTSSLVFSPSFSPSNRRKKRRTPHPKTLEEFQSARKKCSMRKCSWQASRSSATFSLWCAGIESRLAQNATSPGTEFASAHQQNSCLLSPSTRRRSASSASAFRTLTPKSLQNPWNPQSVRITNLLETRRALTTWPSRGLQPRDSPSIPYSTCSKFPIRRIPLAQHPIAYSNPDYGGVALSRRKNHGQLWTTYVRTNILAPLENLCSDSISSAITHSWLKAISVRRQTRQPVDTKKSISPAGT